MTAGTAMYDALAANTINLKFLQQEIVFSL
jgi:hypothetical protein